MQKEVLEVLNAVELTIWITLAKVMLATGIVLFMKSVIERWVAYYQFMSNKRLGIGVKVEVRGKLGKISDYTRKWIFIRCENGNDIIIPIKNWLSEKWTLLNNGEDE
jgi:hypothetical protein